MDDESKKYNKIKKCDKKGPKILFPHETIINKKKFSDYFTINNDDNSMKKALTKYRENNNNINNNKNNKANKNNKINKINKNNKASKTLNPKSESNFLNTYPKKPKFHKNISFKVDKKLLNFAEPRTKVKEFYKIQPKTIDSFSLDNENYDIFLDKDDNINNTKDMTNKNKENTIKGNDKDKNDDKNNKKNKIVKNQKNKSGNVSLSLNNINSCDINDNTIINDDDDNDESIYNGLEGIETSTTINKIKNITNDFNNVEQENLLTEIEGKSNINQINVNEINLEHLVMIEKLYSELIKDIEINKMEIYQNKLSMIKDFLFIYNSESNNYLFNILDNMSSSNDKNLYKSKSTDNKNNTYNFNFENVKKNEDICLIIKQYLISQIIFFYIIILIGLIKKERNIFHSGLHNLAFYFHQNIIVFIYIIFSNFNFNANEDSNDLESINNYEKCIKILNENKTWLDKNNYKKYLQTNNNLSNQIIINLLNHLKAYFNENPYSDNASQNKALESCINLFLLYLKYYKKRKIINILKEIRSSSSVSVLMQLINLNKINNRITQEDDINSKKKDCNSNDNTEESDIETESKINNTLIDIKPKPPFLKPINPKYKYTLVLDLDETLVHYISDNDSAYIQIRPGAEEFIKDLSKFYEIVIFTAALQTYADLVIDGIDPDGVISDRLYRQHTVSVGNANIKDLDKIGRDIKHVIIIDNFLENFSLQPKNGLNIIDFEGNEYDGELEYLKEDLIKLVKLNPNDVRYYLKDIQKNMDKRAIYFQKLNYESNNRNEGTNGNDINEEKNNIYEEILNKNNIIIDKNNENGNSNSEKLENVEDEKVQK